jgi:hypothetical protein
MIRKYPLVIRKYYILQFNLRQNQFQTVSSLEKRFDFCITVFGLVDENGGVFR